MSAKKGITCLLRAYTWIYYFYWLQKISGKTNTIQQAFTKLCPNLVEIEL